MPWYALPTHGLTDAWALVISDIIDTVRKDPARMKETPNPTGAKLNLTFIVVEKR